MEGISYPSPITLICPEINIKILENLSPFDLGKVSCINKMWHEFANDPLIWKKIAGRFPLLLSKPNPEKKSWKQIVIEAINCQGYKDIFPFNNYIYSGDGHNIKVLKPKRPQIPGIYTCRQPPMHNGKIKAIFASNHLSDVFPYEITKLFTGGSEGLIKIWNLKEVSSRKYFIDLEETLTGHSSAIDLIKMTHFTVLSTSKDRTIGIWRLIQKEDKFFRAGDGIFITGHQGRITSIAAMAIENRTISFLSGSEDQTIRLWRVKSDDTSQCLNIFQKHQGTVKAIAYSTHNQELMFSGSADQTIKIWDTDPKNRFKCIQTLQNPSTVTCLAKHLHERELICGLADGQIRVWMQITPSSQWTLQQTLPGHHSSIVSIKYGDNFQNIYSLSTDNTIHIWDKNFETKKFNFRNTIPGINKILY